MSGFSVSWLDLREPADHRARDPRLLDAVAALVDAEDDPLIVDLGSGTGSTYRALAPRLKRPAAWRFIDHDEALLAEIRARVAPGTEVETVVHDLAATRPLPLQDATVITASALLDLTSEVWIARLVATAASRRTPIYAALSYDGTTSFSPSHALDQAVVDAFNRDQRRDKGFGPALGPAAAEALSETMTRAGYRVEAGQSPWRLGSDDAALTADLLRGIAAAVTASAAGPAALDDAAVDDWLAFRLDHLDGLTTVGHLDLLGRP